DRFRQFRLPRRCLWPQADDDVVLSDVRDPDADHLSVGEGYPRAAIRLRSVWIFHPRRFFVDAHMAAGALSNPDARDGRRFHLQCTAIDLRDRSADRRHLDRQPRRLRQSGNHYRLVLHSWADRRAFLARDEGKTAAGGRRTVAGSRRRASLKGPFDVLFLARRSCARRVVASRGGPMSPVRIRIAGALAFAFISAAASGADYPAPKEGDWIARDFRFHTGEVMPELRLHYRTLGNSSGEPALILHGTGGSGANFLTPAFAGELFSSGQPLDASKYFIILPDAIGTGKSAKPSDGLRTKFPKYNYDDMVEAQYRLVTEGLGIRHLRLVLGNSMGGMHTWVWGEKYPDFMDTLVPMASQPTPMASRNWMLRRMMLETIRSDPEWN